MIGLAGSRSRHRTIGGAAFLVALAAALGTIWLSQRDDSAPVPFRSGPQFSLEHPNPFGRPIELASADGTLGAPVVLPDLPRANRASVGSVFGESPGQPGVAPAGRQVDVVFPAVGVDVAYTTPVVYPDPAANYRGYVSEGKPGDADVINLNGTPALLIHWQGDDPASGDPGSVEFVLDGVVIAVIGWRSDAVLRSVATSIQHNAALTG